MEKERSTLEEMERSITRSYRERLWSPFLSAINRYQLIAPGDRIAVCVSGGKDSMLLAKLMQLLHRRSRFPFEVTYLCMDPGYSPPNRQRIRENAALLGLPLTIFDSNIFEVTGRTDRSPCYLCAKMRRGWLYSKARELGCNKIALGHHFSDVIETTVLSMFYGSQLQAMIPKLKSQNFAGMELIRPLYCVHEEDILAWCRAWDLHFLQCACRFTEEGPEAAGSRKRQEVKALIRSLRETNPNIEKSIFNSIHAVNIETFPGYKTGGVLHSFLESYGDEAPRGLILAGDGETPSI